VAAQTKTKLVIVVANDRIEGESYVIPAKHDRAVIVIPGYERVVVHKDEEVVGVYRTPNVAGHPQLWSTAAYVGGFTGLPVQELSELAPEGE
jgi:hypothetical protein